MRIIEYLKFPKEAIKLLIYYLFASSIGRLCYPSYVFKSKYFERPGSIGWSWITRCFFYQKICGFNKHVPWPCSPFISVSNPDNIVFSMNDLNNFMTKGVYYQAFGKLVIGEGTYIAPNVGIITENHSLIDPDKRAETKNVYIGKKCWIGMNAMILPGVVLGNHTIVGAGSVVTKSFIEGNCVICGNPAIKKKDLSVL